MPAAVASAYPLLSSVPATVKGYVDGSNSMVMIATAGVLGTTTRTIIHVTVSGRNVDRRSDLASTMTAPSSRAARDR